MYWHDLKDNDKAQKYFQLAVDTNPTDETYLEYLASFLRITSTDLEKAEKLYKKLLKISPNNLDYLNDYADLLLYKLENEKKASKILKKILKLKKSKQTYLDYLFALRMSDASTKKLEKVYKKALKKYPKSKELQKDYAEYQAEIGNTDFYENYIKEKIAKKPNKIKHRLAFIMHLIDFKKLSEAKIEIDKAYKQFGEKHELLKMETLYLLETKADFEKVDVHFTKIFEKSDNLTDKYVYLTVLHQYKKEKEKIVAYAKDLLKGLENSDIYNKERLINGVKVIINLNSFDQEKVSTKGFENEIKSFQNDCDKMVLEAQKAFVEGNFNKYSAFIGAVDKLEPFNFTMLTLKTSILLQDSNEKGFAFLEQKQQENPKSTNVYKALIGIHLKLGDNENAKKWTLIGLENLPDDEELKETLAYFEGLEK